MKNNSTFFLPEFLMCQLIKRKHQTPSTSINYCSQAFKSIDCQGTDSLYNNGQPINPSNSLVLNKHLQLLLLLFECHPSQEIKPHKNGGFGHASFIADEIKPIEKYKIYIFGAVVMAQLEEWVPYDNRDLQFESSHGHFFIFTVN